MLAGYLELPRTVYLLCLGTLINRAGAFLVPFLTLYVVVRLGRNEADATLGMGAFGIGALAAALVGGHLADHLGRRATMVIALAGSAVMMLIISFLDRFEWLLAAIVLLAFVAEMYRPAASAMIADLTTPSQRPAAYGLMYVTVNLGAAIAPLVGGLLAKYSFRLLFWLDALSSATYAVLILWLVGETLHRVGDDTPAPGATAERPPAEPAPSIAEAARHIARDAAYLRFLSATLLVAIVYVQSFSTLPLQMKSLGMGPDVYGRIIAINGGLIVLFQIVVTAGVQRFERARMLALAAAVTAVGFALQAAAVTGWHFAACVTIWTVGEMIQSPLVPSVVTDLAPRRMRGRYFGLLSMCFAGGNSLAAPLGGQVLSRFGAATLWPACGVIALAGAVLYLSLRGPLARAKQPA